LGLVLLALRQQGCVGRTPNPSKIARAEVLRSFQGAGFRQGKKNSEENTTCIVKEFSAGLAETCP